MGKIIDAKCKCGFQSGEIYFGSGVINYENTLYAPSICRNCNEMLVKNYKFKIPPIKGKIWFDVLLLSLIPGFAHLNMYEYFKFAISIILWTIGLLCISKFDLGTPDFVFGIIIVATVWLYGVSKAMTYCFRPQLIFFIDKLKSVFIKGKTNRDTFCPNCENEVTFYNHSSLLQDCKNTRRKEEEWRWDPEELYENDFWLPKTKYFCPKCRNMKMEFESVGNWD